MPRPTGRGYALLGLSAGTYAAGRVVGTWELYLFAFAFLAALIVSWSVVASSGRRIGVERSLRPQRPVAGDEPEFTFRVNNSSLLPGPQLLLSNSLEGLALNDIELEVGSLRPRGRRTLSARSDRVFRGVHLLPSAKAVAEDPLGIVRSVHRVSPSLPVTVYPRIVQLDSSALHPEMGLRHDWSGQRGLPTPGASEFRGVRPHQPGEPLSHIDWKSTAKTGILMLREMEEPAGSDITMLLDGSADRVTGRFPETNYELAVRATGSIADFALRAGRTVGLVSHERAWRQTRLTPDGGGRRELLEILAEARPNATAPLAEALRHLRTDGPHLLRAQSVTLVTISLDQRLARTLIGLREDGVRLALLHVVGSSFSGADGEDVSALLPFLPPRELRDPVAAAEGEEPGSGLAVETRNLLLSLSSAGIPCLTLSRHEDLVRTLSLWQARRRSPGERPGVAS